MKANFGVRLVLVSICNYLFGNFLFALMWQVFENRLFYWEIAILCTFCASIFSYQTQSRFILRQQVRSYINLRYTLFQLSSLALAIILVPKLAEGIGISIVLAQFGWSAFFSLISLLLLRGGNSALRVVS